MRWSLQRIGGSPQICNMTVLVRLLWSMRTLHDNILMIFRLQIARTCEPGPGSYSSFRSGYSSIRFSGYSGASGQEGRRHSVDAYGTGDSFSNRSSSSRNSSLSRHLSSGRSNVSLSF